MKMTLEEIRGARDYSLTNTNYVYNNQTNKRLTRYWSPRGYYTTIRSDGGRPCRFYHDDKHLRLPEETPIPKNIRSIPDYPNYGVTSYGAVWRISGARNTRPHIVTEQDRNNTPYVQIRNKYGKRHNKKVSQLVGQVWPDA